MHDRPMSNRQSNQYLLYILCILLAINLSSVGPARGEPPCLDIAQVSIVDGELYNLEAPPLRTVDNIQNIVNSAGTVAEFIPFPKEVANANQQQKVLAEIKNIANNISKSGRTIVIFHYSAFSPRGAIGNIHESTRVKAFLREVEATWTASSRPHYIVYSRGDMPIERGNLKNRLHLVPTEAIAGTKFETRDPAAKKELEAALAEACRSLQGK
jgi:hypothetical protein